MTSRRSVEICNQRGLHARASAAFSRLAQTFSSDITVTRAGMTVDARSIMDILSLGASKGLEIEIEAKGGDADEAVQALSELVEQRFGEEI